MAGLAQWFRNVFAMRGHSPPTEGLPHPRPGPSGPGALASGNNAFALALYDRLRAKPGNLFFSPFSIRTALAMAYAGAAGETAREMAAVLRFAFPGDALHAEYGALLSRLDAAGGDRYELAVANALWAQEGSPMRAEFADLCARHYGGGLFGVDFEHAAETTRQRINRWVEERTRERIRGLIPAGGVDQRTRLVLTNAVYFKAQWQTPFEEEWTRDAPFHLATGGSVTAKLMHRTDRLGYLRAGRFQALDLPYRGGDLSMKVLLPDEPRGLEKLERALTPQLLYDCLGGMEAITVHVALPRFKLTWGTFDVGALMASLGMPTAFDGDLADFSGITGCRAPQTGSVHVSNIFHQAFVDMEEEGTEAAAATAVSFATGASPAFRPRPVPVFRADHPFLFAIVDRASGTIVFLGRVADPTRER